MSDKPPAKKRTLSHSDTSAAAPSPKRSNVNNPDVPAAPIASRKRSYESSDDTDAYNPSKRAHYTSNNTEANLFIAPTPTPTLDTNADDEASDEDNNTRTTLSAPPDEVPVPPLTEAPPQPIYECPVCYTDGQSSGHAIPSCGHKICLGCYTNIAVRNPDSPLCPCCRKPYIAVAEILDEEPRQNDILYLSQTDALFLSYILGIGPSPPPPAGI